MDNDGNRADEPVSRSRHLRRAAYAAGPVALVVAVVVLGSLDTGSDEPVPTPSPLVPEGKIYVRADGESSVYPQGGEPRALRLGSRIPLGFPSPDGSKLAVAGYSAVGDTWEAVNELVDLADGTRTPLSKLAFRTDEWMSAVSWSPDVSAVAYHRFARSEDRYELCVVDVPDGSKRCFAAIPVRPPSDTLVAWAPRGENVLVHDADTVVIVRVADGSVDASFSVPDEELTDALQRAEAGSLLTVLYASWSPSGRYIGMVGRPSGPGASVPVVLRRDGTFVAMGAIAERHAQFASWSPTDDVFGYTQTEHWYRHTDVWQLDPATGANERVMHIPRLPEGRSPAQEIVAFDHSPSGRWLALLIKVHGETTSWTLRTTDLSGEHDDRQIALDHTYVNPPLIDWLP